MDSNLSAPSIATPKTELHALTNYQETPGIQLTGTIPKQELRPHPPYTYWLFYLERQIQDGGNILTVVYKC